MTESVLLSNQTNLEISGISGVIFRRFEGESDYPKMVEVIRGSAEADKIERVDMVEDVARYYSHLVNCDPYRDMRFAEIDGNVIGYTRISWSAEESGTQVYRSVGFLLPKWRRRGIGSALLAWGEGRLATIARSQVEPDLRYYEASASDSELGTRALLEYHDYRPVRYFFIMVRPNLDAIPEATIPLGLEVRPVAMEHLQTIVDASREAFRDHWGYSEAKEPTVEQLIDDRNFDPTLWRVAWDGDQVAGMVLGFIDHAENRVYQRKRGWTENICVRRPWRRRGLARALIVESLYAMKERGMREAALGVDAENPSGALRLYESVGFEPVRHMVAYRKAMN